MKSPHRPRQPSRWHNGADVLHGVETMAQHFLTPVVVLARIAYTRRLSAERERGTDRATAHSRAEQQVSDALTDLGVDGGEIGSILRAVYEMERADLRGIRLGANRALDIAFSATHADDLADPSTVGCEPSTIYRRGEDGERIAQTLGRAYSARTPIMRRACPHGVYQPGWSRDRVLLAARRAGRVLP